MDEKLLHWSRRLAALAQNGLTYSSGPYDSERWQEVQQIAVDMLAGGDVEVVKNLEPIISRQTGYATPKIVVRAAAFQDGKILMVRERADGKWALPGGWVDVHDTPRQAVEREIWEETGFRAEATKLVYVRDNPEGRARGWPFHIYDLFFLCRIIDGKATASYETPEVGFFSPDSLPELSPTRNRPDDIARMFRHNADLSLPADFD